jgi:cytochrome c peroxidase
MRRCLQLLFLSSLGCAPARLEPQPPDAPLHAGPLVRASAAASDAELLALRAAYAGAPDTWPAPTLDAGVEHRELGPVERPVPADDGRLAARQALGELLFFDARLSGSGQLACISCHDPELGLGDGRAASFGEGVRSLGRNAPSLWNTGLRKSWFWDGRASSLEQQALLVLTSPREMNTTPEAVVATLSSSRGYQERFIAAYGDGTVTIERVLTALADFERGFVSDGSSNFDHFLRGETEALTPAALRGLHLFRTKARCLNCHNGPLMTDEQFHDVGLSYYGREREDLGRYRVTQDPADVGRFRTPSLRNLGRTGPYMHNGLFELEGVINMYNAGMPSLRRTPEQAADPLFPTKSPLLRPLELGESERADLLAFLESLTERKRRFPIPELPAIGDL